MFWPGPPRHKDAPFSGPFFVCFRRFTGDNDSTKGDTQHKDQNLFFKSCLEEDPLFAHQVQSLERMLRVREKLASGVLPGTICAGSTSAVEPDSHDVVSEVSAGSSAAGLVLHDLEGFFA